MFSSVSYSFSNVEVTKYGTDELNSPFFFPPQAERPDVLALLNKVTMARQKTEELQQRNHHPLTMSSPETTAALSPLSHAEVELLRHIRVSVSRDS